MQTVNFKMDFNQLLLLIKQCDMKQKLAIVKEILANDIIDENSKEYKLFFEGQIKKSLKTKRVKSGNSLREII